MIRRLDAEEQAIWDRVAQTVRPLHPRVALPGGKPAEDMPAQPVVRRKDAGPRRAVTALPPPVAKASSAATESLDASWDKRISSGRLQPEITIDLHGLSRESARHLLYRRVVDAEARGIRVILVITGKGLMPGPSPADLMEGRKTRGAIRADFPRWLGEEALSGRIAAVRRAHPRHGGAGAAYLILKRKR